ncbi:MAG: ribosomal protein S18-alanine N-acetyltransferase [Pseudomonadota bacterium]
MIIVAGKDAAPALAAVHARAFAPSWSAAEIEKLMANPASFALVAQEREVHGFVLAWAIVGESEILTLAVAPEHRRRGVGRALLDAAMAAAITRGASAMVLDVADDNAPARTLYERAGFTQAGRRPLYYHRAEGNVDALILRRILADA